ncbi:tellurite resistance TerB family protein [Butyrivibrio sp. YAB3001]|uniref:tellurite resistance TerB family protein n=1 Tax=Butyrivibrio sp. YAB3001 TaxID=1520812 RepID=UPI0008F65CFC|nr:TerB family tellurite resistance protein [Butyrivibrio sp. YAB3001]SFC34583.1 hypothetical protein SAMN02910398_02046 [Butyrivibrio sp. YAB3001]
MYLSRLNNQQKAIFLGLAFNLATTDGDYSESEKAMISTYCDEMHIFFDKTSMVKSNSVLLEEMSKISDIEAKRIVVFELIGLALADGNYHVTERNFIKTMLEEFGLEDGYDSECESVVNEYLNCQSKISQLVLG